MTQSIHEFRGSRGVGNRNSICRTTAADTSFDVLNFAIYAPSAHPLHTPMIGFGSHSYSVNNTYFSPRGKVWSFHGIKKGLNQTILGVICPRTKIPCLLHDAILSAASDMVQLLLCPDREKQKRKKYYATDTRQAKHNNRFSSFSK